VIGQFPLFLAERDHVCSKVKYHTVPCKIIKFWEWKFNLKLSGIEQWRSSNNYCKGIWFFLSSKRTHLKIPWAYPILCAYNTYHNYLYFRWLVRSRIGVSYIQGEAIIGYRWLTATYQNTACNHIKGRYFAICKNVF
jgi:hypothetical protein